VEDRDAATFLLEDPLAVLDAATEEDPLAVLEDEPLAVLEEDPLAVLVEDPLAFLVEDPLDALVVTTILGVFGEEFVPDR